MKPGVLICIDTGGTFTDFVCVEGNALRIHKVPSTPSDPAEAILGGLRDLLGQASAETILYGTTVATNALIERKGAVTALVTTAGFEDVIEIGRQVREKIYDMDVMPRPPLVPRSLRLGVRERVTAEGIVERHVSAREIEKIARRLKERGVESVAVCFLNSYANPVNEVAGKKSLRRHFESVSASSEILPEYREYERFSTTCANAYVAPLLDRHVGKLLTELRGPRSAPGCGSELCPDLLVMQSNGGLMSARRAGKTAVHSILSGPAAGVLGAFKIAKEAGFSKVITLDMGGTSTDVSLCDGRIGFRTDTVAGGCPIKAAVVDVHTVGAGGGSVAWVDRGGALRVGPQSAGAEPGPACYGTGITPTVTDANLLLGRLSPEHFLGGRMRLYPERAKDATRTLSRKLKLSVKETSQAIVLVADATVIRAIRVVSVERGHDPSQFALVAFGGAAPLHAIGLARELSISRVLVPAFPGVLSAKGLLSADVMQDYSQTILLRIDPDMSRVLERIFRKIEVRAERHLKEDGVIATEVRLERYVDVRYVGQSYEVTVPFSDGFERHFHSAHDRLYGHSSPGKEIEIVNVRVRAVGTAAGKSRRTSHVRPEVSSRRAGAARAGAATRAIRKVDVYDSGRSRPIPLYERDSLLPGSKLRGPALIVEESSTTYLPGDVRGLVDEHGNLVLEI